MDSYINEPITLELARGGIQKTLHARQGDAGVRRLRITLTNHHHLYELDGVSVTPYAILETGEQVTLSTDGLTAEGDTILWIPPAGLLATAGLKVIELKIQGPSDSRIVYTPQFALQVEATVGAGNPGSVVPDPAHFQRVINELDDGASVTLDDADQMAVYDASESKTIRVLLSKLIAKVRAAFAGWSVAELADAGDYVKENDDNTRLVNAAGFITSAALTDYVDETALAAALADYTPTAQLPTNVSYFTNDAQYVDQTALSAVSAEVTKINTTLGTPTELVAGTTWTAGKAVSAVDGTESANSYMRCSDYIDITGTDAIVYSRVKIGSSTQPNHGIAFYNTDKTFLSGVKSNYNAGSGNYLYTVYAAAVPSGAKYVRLTAWKTTYNANACTAYDADAYVESYPEIRRGVTGILRYQDLPQLLAIEGTERSGNINSSGKLTIGGVRSSIELVNSGYGAVTVTAGTYAAIVSFLTASIAGLSSGDAVSLCSGEPAQNVISAGKTDTFIVPTDCQYIVIMAMTTSGDQRPVGGFMFYDDHPLVDAAQRITDKAVNDYFPQLNDPVKACILGASIEAGTTHETSTSDAVTNPAKAYLTVALQNNGVTVTNMAHGGMGFLRTASDGTVFKDLIDATDFTEFDSVYISLGSNDWAYNEPLGTTADTGTDTVCGMLKYTLNAIYTAKPSIKVFVIIPCMRKKGTYGDASTQWGWEGDNGRTTGKYSLHDLHDAIKTICDYNFVEVFEDPARGIVNMYNIDTVYPDGTHPTQATMALMAKNMTGRIAMKNAAQAGVSPESVLPGGSGTNNLLRWNTTAAAWLPGADRLPAVTNSDAGKVPTANDQGGYTLQTPESYTLPAATASALGGVKVDSGNSVKADTYGKLTVNEAALNAQHMTSLMVASIFNQDPNIGVLIDDGSMTEEELWGLFETYNMDVIDYAKQAFIFVPAREYDQDHPWHYYDEYYEDKYRTLYAGMLYLIGLNSNNALYFNPIAGDDLRQLLINGIQ